MINLVVIVDWVQSFLFMSAMLSTVRQARPSRVYLIPIVRQARPSRVYLFQFLPLGKSYPLGCDSFLPFGNNPLGWTLFLCDCLECFGLIVVLVNRGTP